MVAQLRFGELDGAYDLLFKASSIAFIRGKLIISRPVICSLLFISPVISFMRFLIKEADPLLPTPTCLPATQLGFA